MRIIRFLSLAALAFLVTGCGGMGRTIGILPNTLDNLAEETKPFRANRSPQREDDQGKRPVEHRQ